MSELWLVKSLLLFVKKKSVSSAISVIRDGQSHREHILEPHKGKHFPFSRIHVQCHFISLLNILPSF
jgi:hypothetical protein